MIRELVDSLANYAQDHDGLASQTLPEGEHVLWRGQPEWRALARRVFKTRWIAAAFVLLAIVRGATATLEGASLAETFQSVAWTLLPAACGLSLIYLYSWLEARSTEYIVTDRRVAMQIGIAIPIQINLPFSKIRSADLYASAGSTRDIALTPEGDPGVQYPLLWPHAFLGKRGDAGCRHVLRCLADGEVVASILSGALHASLPAIEAPSRLAPREGPSSAAGSTYDAFPPAATA